MPEIARPNPVEQPESQQPESRVEKRESPRERRSFEYLDAEGNRLGVLEAEFEAAETSTEAAREMAERGGWKKLSSMVLRGEKDGVPTEFDVMTLANPHERVIHVTDTASGFKEAAFDSKSKRVVAPTPDSPVSLGVVLHELGHAGQDMETKYSELGSLFEDGPPKENFEDFQFYYEELRHQFPDRVKDISESELRSLFARQGLTDFARGTLDTALEREEAATRARVNANGAALSEVLRDALSVDVLAAEPGSKALEEAGIRRYGRDPDVDPAATDADTLFKNIEMHSNPRNVNIRFDDGRREIDMRTRLTGGDFFGETVHVIRQLSEQEYAERKAKVTEAQERETKTRERAAAVRAELTKAEEAFAKAFQESGMQDALDDIQRLLERDATRRAYQWMRKIREETGVDLFAETVVRPVEGLMPDRQGNDCADSAQEAFAPDADEYLVTDVFTALSKDGLRSYGGQHPPKSKRASSEAKDITPPEGGEAA